MTLAPSETTTPPSIDLDALDVTALARSSPLPICVLGIDRDPIAAVLAEANSLACGVSAATRIIESDASSAELGGVRWLHIDPDRRADGRRSTRADRFSPDVDVIERLVRDALRHDGGAAVKLAPVTAAPDRWIAQGECEWIGSRGECRQQVVWLGELARSAGTRSATVVDARTGRPATIRTSPSDAARQCTAANVQVRELGASPAQFLYEPHAAVLAARLEAELADRHGLESVAANIAYFGGDRLIDDPLLAAFAIEDVLPLDERQLRGALRLRKIGRLEIKKRGVDISPEQLRARLRLDGDGDATLLLFRDSRGGRAVLARRVHTSTSQTDS